MRADRDGDRLEPLAAISPVPRTSEAWLREVASAWNAAQKPTGLSTLTDLGVDECDRFQVAPIVCMRLRGLQGNNELLQKAVKEAFTTVEESGFTAETLEASPELVFALAYIASHVGAGLLKASTATEVVNFIEDHLDRLRRYIGDGEGPH